MPTLIAVVQLNDRFFVYEGMLFMVRASGILMPLFSLPSKYGIGTLGREAYRFIDFLEKSGQTYWQMLPVGPTGFGDSPYQSFSVCAGNPYFIDLDMLIEEKLLTKSEVEAVDWGGNSEVDYALLYKERFKLLDTAASRFLKKKSIEFDVFCRYHNWWLDDYAMFMAIKDSLSGCSFDCWEDGLKFRREKAMNDAKERLAAPIASYKVQQFFFHKQWKKLKKYAKSKGILLIGDIPIYTAFDSADVWGSPQLFQLDEKLNPAAVAGVPPDAFSADGQLWGNPLYDWDYMKEDGYSWWIRRFKEAFTLFDYIRIDHFRAFSAYFSIPAQAETAAEGKWVKGPGEHFFEVLKQSFGELPVIAEDLGILDDDVRSLLKYTGFPGMKVLQFAFDPEADSDYLPHNIGKNSVVYTGTHDNDTAMGFCKDGDEEQVKFAREYLRIGENDSFNWGLIKSAMATSGETVILQMQDFLGLDNTARINTPSVKSGNWRWRIDYSCINDWLAKIIRDTTATYRRLPIKKETKPQVKKKK